MTGRPSLRRLAVRGGLAVVGAQVATAAGLVAVDQARKKDRPYKEFPRSPVTTVPVEGGELSIYSYGDDVYDAMLEAIGTSTTSVMLETFIWKDDVLGQRFKDALVAAHERGVTVHVIYDRFANLVVPQEFFRFPPGVHVKPHPVFAGGGRASARDTPGGITASSSSSTTTPRSSAGTTSGPCTRRSGGTPTHA